MRRLLVIAALVGFVIAAPTASPRSDVRPKARLQLVSLAPLTVHGQHFRTRERVKLTVVAGAQYRTRRVRADRSGNFVARFDGLSADRCSEGVGVNAVGARGSRAAIAAKRPQPDCPPGLGPAEGPPGG
jgi:hypothetical protein